MNVLQFAKEIGVTLTKRRNPYYAYGSEYHGKDVHISYGVEKLMGGWYACVSVQTKDCDIYRKDPPGFGSFSIGVPRRNLSFIKDEVFKKAIEKHKH